jgi:hypothetical protein
MKSKSQGEGDYEAARRYNAAQAEFVKQGGASKRKPTEPIDAKMTAAEKVGSARAKRPEHDSRDATVMNQAVRAKTKSKGKTHL